MRANHLVEGSTMEMAIVEAVKISHILSVAGLEVSRMDIIMEALITIKRVRVMVLGVIDIDLGGGNFMS